VVQIKEISKRIMWRRHKGIANENMLVEFTFIFKSIKHKGT